MAVCAGYGDQVALMFFLVIWFLIVNVFLMSVFPPYPPRPFPPPPGRKGEPTATFGQLFNDGKFVS